MDEGKIREKIYEFIKIYVDTPEPKKLCSSIEDLVDELVEIKVKKLNLSIVTSCCYDTNNIYQNTKTKRVYCNVCNKTVQ